MFVFGTAADPMSFARYGSPPSKPFRLTTARLRVDHRQVVRSIDLAVTCDRADHRRSDEARTPAAR